MRSYLRYSEAVLLTAVLLCTGCSQRAATVMLTNGDSFTGRLKEQTVSIDTEYGTFSFPSSRVLSMTFDEPSDGKPKDTLQAENVKTWGDTLFHGDVRQEDLDLSLELLTGQTIRLAPDQVKSVTFRER